MIFGSVGGGADGPGEDTIKTRRTDIPVLGAAAATDDREASSLPTTVASRGDLVSVRDRVRRMQGITEIAQGIEALEAVAAAAAASSSRSSGKLSPRASWRKGEHDLIHFSSNNTPRDPDLDDDKMGDDYNPKERGVFPSDAPGTDRRSTGRGMAALSVAGSRRTSFASGSNMPSSWLKKASSMTSSSNGGFSAASRGELGCLSPPQLISVSSDVSISTTSNHAGRTSGMLEPRRRDQPAAQPWMEESSTASTARSSRHNSHNSNPGAEADGDRAIVEVSPPSSESTATASTASPPNKRADSRVSPSGKAASRILRRSTRGSSSYIDSDKDSRIATIISNTSSRGNSRAVSATTKRTTVSHKAPHGISDTAAASLEQKLAIRPNFNPKEVSPRASGFNAITMHEAFSAADKRRQGDRAATFSRRRNNSSSSTSSSSSSSSSSDGNNSRDLQAKGWWVNSTGGARGGRGMEQHQESSRRESLKSSGGSKPKSSPVRIRVENAELRIESRRLEEALTAAKESAMAAEERSKEFARQAASRVRQIEAQRASAEEAVREAEARAYSLSATVQVLKSTSDYASEEGAWQGNLTPRGVEAEVTAAYQGILQDMDMERAALQQQLLAVEKENDVLRSRAMGTRMRSFSGTTDREEREPSPLPTPRSFGRPKARGISTARDSSGSDLSAREERLGSVRAHASPRTIRRGGRLREFLGARVRLVQLEGLKALRGGNINGSSADSSSPCEGTTMSPENPPELRTPQPSAEAPPSPPPSLRRNGNPREPSFPWSKEKALWYGGVSLIVAPGCAAEKDTPKAPAHSILLTDDAMYVIQTRHAGSGSVDFGRTAESDSLCRLERHRVGSLSLPLETRALQNGDEVAVRSNAVVLRLQLDDEASIGGTTEQAEDSTGGENHGANGVIPVTRGYLWLSCESNETRGELVEHLCLWFQSQKEPRRSSRQGSCGRMTPAAEAAAAIATAARAMHEAAAAVSAAANTTPAAISAAGEAADLAAAAVAAAKVAEEAATLSGSNTEEDGKGSGSIQAGERLTSGEGSNGLDVSLEEQESEEDREADVLEVDQILMKDLLDDLGEERSLNVTALLLANAEELAPPCARGDDAVQKC